MESLPHDVVELIVERAPFSTEIQDCIKAMEINNRMPCFPRKTIEGRQKSRDRDIPMISVRIPGCTL